MSRKNSTRGKPSGRHITTNTSHVWKKSSRSDTPGTSNTSPPITIACKLSKELSPILAQLLHDFSLSSIGHRDNVNSFSKVFVFKDLMTICLQTLLNVFKVLHKRDCLADLAFLANFPSFVKCLCSRAETRAKN